MNVGFIGWWFGIDEFLVGKSKFLSANNNLHNFALYKSSVTENGDIILAPPQKTEMP